MISAMRSRASKAPRPPSDPHRQTADTAPRRASLPGDISCVHPGPKGACAEKDRQNGYGTSSRTARVAGGRIKPRGDRRKPGVMDVKIGRARVRSGRRNSANRGRARSIDVRPSTSVPVPSPATRALRIHLRLCPRVPCGHPGLYSVARFAGLSPLRATEELKLGTALG